MLVFKIDRFEVLEAFSTQVHAMIGWPPDGREDYDASEETQEILWDVQPLSHLEDALKIAAALIASDLINGDRIICEYEKIARLMNWPESRFEHAFSDLLSIKVHMLDDGKRTDYFFLHL